MFINRGFFFLHKQKWGLVFLSLVTLLLSSHSLKVEAGDTTAPNLEVVFLVDQSYSMFRWKEGEVGSGTDPDGRRIDAVELLINLLVVLIL